MIAGDDALVIADFASRAKHSIPTDKSYFGEAPKPAARGACAPQKSRAAIHSNDTGNSASQLRNSTDETEEDTALPSRTG